MRSLGIILCAVAVLASGYPQWPSNPSFNDWGQQQQQLERSFYQDQLAALGISASDYQRPADVSAQNERQMFDQVERADYADPSTYDIPVQYQYPQFGFPASNIQEAPVVYADERPMAPITRRRMGQKAPLSDIWRTEKKLDRNADLSWPDFFNFNAFEGTRHQPAIKFEVPQVEEVYVQQQPVEYADPVEQRQILQPENPFPQSEISNWYSNNYGEEQAYVPHLAPQSEPEPVEPPKNIQDQVELVKKEKSKEPSALLSLLGLGKHVEKPVEPQQVRQEPEFIPEVAPVPDLRGHRLQPKRSMLNTVKILMGIPPVFESVDEHMMRHQLQRGRMDEETSPKIWGHSILNLLTNGRWGGDLWYPIGSEIWK